MKVTHPAPIPFCCRTALNFFGFLLPSGQIDPDFPLAQIHFCHTILFFHFIICFAKLRPQKR